LFRKNKLDKQKSQPEAYRGR